MSEAENNPFDSEKLKASIRKAAENSDFDVVDAKNWFQDNRDKVIGYGIVAGSLFIGYKFGFRRADKQAVRALKTVFGVKNVKNLEGIQKGFAEIQRQALGYGYEIGTGAPLREFVNTSPDNPFLNENWRELVKKGAENVSDFSKLARPSL